MRERNRKDEGGMRGKKGTRRRRDKRKEGEPSKGKKTSRWKGMS